MDVNVKDISASIKEAKEELLAQKGFERSEKERIEKSKEKIRGYFESLSEQDIDRLERNGVYVRQLMNFNLEEVTNNPELAERFKQTYTAMVQSIMELVESKRSAGA